MLTTVSEISSRAGYTQSPLSSIHETTRPPTGTSSNTVPLIHLLSMCGRGQPKQAEQLRGREHGGEVERHVIDDVLE
jgi:hypothetical protein